MNNSNLIDLGLGKICRTCLADEGDMKSVLSDSSDCPEIQILKMIECCASLEINENDGLPAVICSQCELRLNNAYNFRELCQRSNIALRKYIENATRHSIKQENNIEQIFIVEDESDPLKSEFTQEILEPINFNEEIAGNNSNDSYDKTSQRKIQKCNQISVEIINQAISENRKKINEKRECALIHKDLKERWCNICIKEVNDPLHLKEHNKIRSYSCTLCEKSFSSQGHLTEHIRIHSMERPHKCKVCYKEFLSMRHLKIHKRIHSDEKPYSCPHCEKSFTQDGTLQGHIRTHTGFKPFRCEICVKNFTTYSGLAMHKRQTGHNSFSKLKDLDVIIELNEPTIADEIVDEENSIKIETSTQPAQDCISTAAPKDTQRKLCTVCGKTLSTASKLRLHMRVHTGETPYKCQYCAKRFSTRGQLVAHVRTHTGERPYVCHVCQKGFAQSSVLNTHMKLHTGRPEQCEVCQQRFCRPAELKLHMRKHTGEKPFLCTECGQTFIQRSHLMEHIKIHSDERPYKCHLCERAFKQSSSLKSHIKIHTGSKPYKCPQCVYACRQRYSLTQHMKQHNVDLPQSYRPHVCLICNKAFSTLAMLTSHSTTVHQTII